MLPSLQGGLLYDCFKCTEHPTGHVWTFAGPYFELADRPSLVRIAKGKTWTDAVEIFLVGRGQACPRGTWGVPRGGQFSLRTKS